MGVSGRTEASSPTLRAEPGLALDTPRSRSRDELELTVVSSRGLRVFFCKRPVLGAPQPLRGEPIRKRALEESVDRSLLDPVRIKIALLLALRTYKKELVVAYDPLTASDEKATDVRPHGRGGGNAGDVPRSLAKLAWNMIVALNCLAEVVGSGLTAAPLTFSLLLEIRQHRASAAATRRPAQRQAAARCRSSSLRPQAAT